MPIDQEQLRAERVRIAEANRAGDWSQREAELIARDRAELAAQREAEQHQAELAAAGKFFEAKAAAASKAGNPDEASLWTAAGASLKAGQWPIHRRIASDPEITRWQGVRTRLAYAGQTRRLDA